MPLLTKALVQRIIEKNDVGSYIIEGMNRVYEYEIQTAVDALLLACNNKYDFNQASPLLLEFKKAIDIYSETFETLYFINLSKNIYGIIHNIIIQNNNRKMLWIVYPFVDENGLMVEYANDYPLPVNAEREKSNEEFISMAEVVNLQNDAEIFFSNVSPVFPRHYQYDNETIATSEISQLYFSHQTPDLSRSPSPSTLSTSAGSDASSEVSQLALSREVSFTSRSPSPPINPEPELSESYYVELSARQQKLEESQQLVISLENKIEPLEHEYRAYQETPARDFAQIRIQRLIKPQIRSNTVTAVKVGKKINEITLKAVDKSRTSIPTQTRSDDLPVNGAVLIGIKDKNMNQDHIAAKERLKKNFSLHVKKTPILERNLVQMKETLDVLQNTTARIGSAYVAKLIEGTFFYKRKAIKTTESELLIAQKSP